MSVYLTDAQVQHLTVVRGEITKALEGGYGDLALVAQFLDELAMLVSKRDIVPLLDGDLNPLPDPEAVDPVDCICDPNMEHKASRYAHQADCPWRWDTE